MTHYGPIRCGQRYVSRDERLQNTRDGRMPSGERPEDIDMADFRLKFGKHAGKTLDEIPITYVRWLADNCHFPGVRLMAQRFVRERGEDVSVAAVSR